LPRLAFLRLLPLSCSLPRELAEGAKVVGKEYHMKSISQGHGSGLRSAFQKCRA
jgi:hypothetical protein